MSPTRAAMPDPCPPERPGSGPARRPWTPPTLVPLPPLEQLTLQTGAITGTCTPGAGCTFSFLPTPTAHGPPQG